MAYGGGRGGFEAPCFHGLPAGGNIAPPEAGVGGGVEGTAGAALLFGGGCNKEIGNGKEGFGRRVEAR